MTETRHFLYRIQPTRSEMLFEGLTDEETRIVSEHYAYLKAMTKKGIVILAGRTLNADETSFGIVILDVESEEKAQKIMENDPAVRQRVMNAQLFHFRIALMAEG